MRAFVAVLVLLASGASIASAEWRWPFGDEAEAEAIVVDDSLWLEITGRTGGAGDTFAVYPVAPGEVIYRSRAPGASGGTTNSVPNGADHLVMRHEGEIWSFYRSPELRIEAGIENGTAAADPHLPFLGRDYVTFGLYDAVESVMINPRAILPETSLLPEDEMPVLGFLQNGELVRARNLRAGDAELVVPEEWLALVALPRRLVVLVDGFLGADIDFLFPEEVAVRRVEGGLYLMRTDLPPGRTAFEIESVRFDGSIDRRTIVVDVPQPMPLDTP